MYVIAHIVHNNMYIVLWYFCPVEDQIVHGSVIHYNSTNLLVGLERIR